MDLQHAPETFGVFKPVGCSVFTWRTASEATFAGAPWPVPATIGDVPADAALPPTR